MSNISCTERNPIFLRWLQRMTQNMGVISFYPSLLCIVLVFSKNPVWLTYDHVDLEKTYSLGF